MINDMFWDQFGMDLFSNNPMDDFSLLQTTNLQDSCGYHAEGGLDQWMVSPLWFEMFHMDSSKLWYFQPWTLLFHRQREFSKREGRQLSWKPELYLHLYNFVWFLPTKAPHIVILMNGNNGDKYWDLIWQSVSLDKDGVANDDRRMPQRSHHPGAAQFQLLWVLSPLQRAGVHAADMGRSNSSPLTAPSPSTI